MPILLQEDLEYALPTMHRVRQAFANKHISDIAEAVRSQLNKPEILEKIKPKQQVAIAVGSRGIRNIFEIVENVVKSLQTIGAEPFIVSAMGSHGSGTPEGQREVLTGYGITEETLGVKIVTDVDVVKLGETRKGFPVYFDKAALGADQIIIINRVKLHTDFVGDLQSGLCKMMVIGLGNHIGCSAIHEEELDSFADTLEDAAQLILNTAPISFGVAILENAYDQTAHIEAIEAEKMIVREKELVRIAKTYMPRIMLEEIDVLVVEEIGKNISGSGFDPNILGRGSCLKTFVLKVPSIQQMVLLKISALSHGNAIGMGMFDVITKNVFEEADLEAVYANAIASKGVQDAKIPLMVETEDEAIRVALKICRRINRKNPRIVKIKNTLELEFIEVSDALLDEVSLHPNLTLIGN